MKEILGAISKKVVVSAVISMNKGDAAAFKGIGLKDKVTVTRIRGKEIDPNYSPDGALKRLISIGLIECYVSSWGYQELGYCLTDVGSQVYTQLTSSKPDII